MSEKRLVVQKTRYIIDMCRKLTLSESKLVDCYLAKINSRDPNSKEVELSMRELEDLWNVSELKPSEVRKHIENLMGDTLLVKGDVRSKEKVTQTNFFAETTSFRDDSGRWVVRLVCTDEALPYIFDIEDLGYVKYELGDVMQFRSKYTYLMFLYILRNAFRRDWVISIEKLKEHIGAADVERYAEFKFFNSEVLKKTHADILKSGSVVYQYILKKQGRSYSHVEFKVITVLGEVARKREADKISLEKAPLLSLQTVTEGALSENELKEVVALLRKYGMVDEHQQVNYLSDCMERLNAQPSVKYKARYLMKLIENDYADGFVV